MFKKRESTWHDVESKFMELMDYIIERFDTMGTRIKVLEAEVEKLKKEPKVINNNYHTPSYSPPLWEPPYKVTCDAATKWPFNT